MQNSSGNINTNTEVSKNKSYKLVALDIDGTLIGKNRIISPKTKQRIKQLQEMNIPVCLVTGRNIKNTMPVYKALGLTTPMVTMDGAVIYDPITSKFLHNNPISSSENQKHASDIFEILINHHIYVEIATYDNYYKYIKAPELNLYLYGGSSFGPINNLKEYLWGVRRIRNISKFKNDIPNFNFYQFMGGGSLEELEKATNCINELGIENLNIRNTLWKGYIFISPLNNIKSSGVSFLCEYFNITQDEVIAMGDEHNDIDMIKAAGMGVAMGNAIESVKNVSNFTTKTNVEEGVCYALEHFFDL